MSKTKTETQDLKDQYYKSVTGMDWDKQKDWKSHGKQKIQHTGSCTQYTTKHHTMFNDSSICWQLPLIIAVYQTMARTHNISKVRCLIDN